MIVDMETRLGLRIGTFVPADGVHDFRYPAVRGIGAMHHVALKAKPDQYKALLGRIKDLGIDYSQHGTEQAGSVYMRDPDNALIEVTCR